jgi:hypothetical protein
MSKYEKPPLRVNRRLFVKTFAALSGALFLPKIIAAEAGPLEPSDIDPIWGVVFDENLEALGFGEAFQLAKRFDSILDRLPDPQIPVNEDAAIQILQEANNLFVTERFVREVTSPTLVNFELLPPANHLNTLGYSNCVDRISLNVRLTNPMSAWYEREEFFWTVIHESAHLQQGKEICLDAPYDEEYRQLIEATAELMTAEVTAILALGGNYRAFYSLIDALRAWSVQAAWSGAIAAGRMDEFRRLRRQLSPGAISEAGFERTMRRHSQDLDALSRTLNAYGAKPLNLAIKATVGRGGVVNKPALPKVSDLSSGTPTEHTPSIVLDDLIYLLRNLDALAQDYIDRHQGEEAGLR